MSIPVAIEDLGQYIAQRGPGFVVSTSADGRPHVAHQPMTWRADDRSVEMPVGKSTAKNVAERPLVCLLFPATTDDDDGYSLIVDGDARPDTSNGTLVVAVTNCVLHRPAPTS